jgi:hypothetical protein
MLLNWKTTLAAIIVLFVFSVNDWGISWPSTLSFFDESPTRPAPEPIPPPAAPSLPPSWHRQQHQEQQEEQQHEEKTSDRALVTHSLSSVMTMDIIDLVLRALRAVFDSEISFWFQVGSGVVSRWLHKIPNVEV